MTIDRELETTRIVRSWLRTDGHESADSVLESVLVLLDATPQHRAQRTVRRFADMNSFAKLAIAAAAVVVVAVVGIGLLPMAGTSGGITSSTSPSLSPSASASASTSASASGYVWHGGSYDVGRYQATLDGVSFSFAVPTSGWSSYRYLGMLEKGTYPTSSYAWIGMPSPDDGMVATDPCSGMAKHVGGSVDDLALAETTIPGTGAVGPTDTTIGGIPAKLVVLTIRPDIGCAARDFMLSGEGSNYPNSLDSTIRMWFFEFHGKRYVVYSDQAGRNPPLGQEIREIVDSIQLE